MADAGVAAARGEAGGKGTHGERPLLGVVLVSTAYKLPHRSTIPVLVVPAKSA